MFRINRGQIEQETKRPSAKQDPLTSNSRVFDSMKLVFVNLIDAMTSFPVYNVAHWACNVDRWLDNLQSDNLSTYQRGEIVFLDLGAQNFKYEPSYTHACVVLANRKKSILIVPCSSQKYKSGYRDIIDATPADGFMKNTGIQSENFRWVNKNRIVSRTGKKVSSAILNKIDDVLISFAPSNKREIKNLTKKIEEEKFKATEKGIQIFVECISQLLSGHENMTDEIARRLMAGYGLSIEEARAKTKQYLPQN